VKKIIFCAFSFGLMLSGSFIFADNWDYDITVEAAGQNFTITAGVRPFASATYDVLWDIPYLGTPLDSAMMWKSFENLMGIPIWLTADRKCDAGNFWQWDLTPGLLLTLAEKTVRWEPTDLPDGEWYIGTYLVESEWVSMNEIDSFVFTIDDGAIIRRYDRPITDASGPVIQLVEPEEDATEVPINTGIAVEITDEQSWVDDTTISIQLEDQFPVWRAYPIEYGYHVFVELILDLPPDEEIELIVRAGNVADVIAYTTDTLRFHTSSETAVYSIHGEIQPTDGGDPNGAIVSLFDTDSLVKADTVAPDGEYLLDNINSGFYTAIVELSGYKNGGGFVYIMFEGQLRNFTLEPDDLPAIDENHAVLPESIILEAYPNPFNSSCVITVNGVGAPLQIEIYDLRGTLRLRSVPDIPRSLSGVETNNSHTFIWRPDESISSGIYIVWATAGNETITKRIVYLQ